MSFVMMSMRTVCGNPRWFARVLVGVLFAGALADGAIAQDRFYILRDGRKVRLMRSHSELGVVFRSRDDAEAGRRRLEAAGIGIVENMEGAPNAPVKILRVANTGDVDRGLLLADDAVEEARPVYRFAGVESPLISTGTIVVKLRADLPSDQRQQLWGDYGLAELEAMHRLHDVYIVRPIDDGNDEVLGAEQLVADHRTLWAQPNFRRVAERCQVVASDEFFDEQWHLDNTGQLGGEEDADIDAPEAWRIADGEGVLFGMLDDGCDVDHEDLKDNYIGTGQDIALPPDDPGYTDPRPKQEGDAHATAVMGLAVAAGNSLGVRGVSFRSRFTVSRGLFGSVTDVDVASAYTFALEQGVDVHINSWGITGPDPAVIEDAIETAFREGRDLDGPGGTDPLGMVIVFATGNEGAENVPGFELSTLPAVIGVGSSDDRDGRSSFSNYGPELNFLAPGDSLIATTDNEDGEDKVEEGYNVAGLNEDTLFEGHILGPEIDPTGKYTGNFAGTSAACPIAAGVAGLILSVNPQLTATDVRLIMEHTCDKVSPLDAWYNGITDRSLTYGYGRVNAERAVRAARDSLDNGGLTWPDVPTNVTVVGTTLLWRAGVGTDEFLVVESDNDFGFVPEDEVCYDTSQLNCESSMPETLPSGVSVLYVGCSGDCGPGSGQSVGFDPPSEARKCFAIYSRSSIGRYSFGTAIDSEGGGGGGGDDSQPARGPAPTIAVSPRSGTSPLMVQFNGNAVSEIKIDETRTTWDFDVDDGVTVDATTTSATYTYVVPPGETRTFTACLTMYDVDGNAGSAAVQIRVDGSDVDDDGGMIGGSGIQIIVGVPGTTGSDVSEGTSPFEVELSIDATTLSGTLQSVLWVLHDGTRATSLVVPYTYINNSDKPLYAQIAATVTTVTTGGTTLTSPTSRTITVHPGIAVVDPGEPNLPGTTPEGAGGSAAPCGSLGMVPLLFGTVSWMWLRRRRF
ncbi:MAG: S8 family serine peptidase [Phycisphaerae bacterium]